jgi:hypothetical protein
VSGPEPHPEALARAFHEAYERLAPSFGYETRKDTAVPWEDVPEPNRSLMIAVAAEVGDVLVGRLERAEEALRKIASGELSTRRISDEVDVVIDGKPGKIISVVGLRPSEVAREALGVPPPGGPDS